LSQVTEVELIIPDLTREETHYAVKKLGREPNEVEWAMLEAEWSEHCSYKSSRQLLKQLPSKGPRVLVGPGFDAGVVDVGDGWVVTLHIESHNHPSAIDPYGGAATGVGGVVRDILSLGTRPIALLDPLRFGSIENSHSKWLFDNVVRGIGDYGNCIGVPTVGGEVEFDPSFQRNCLVDVVCIGLGRKKELVLGEAKHQGDLVYLVGGSTGRDGIHGASFASRNLTEKSETERSAVQVPDPFTKKLIIEAVLEAVRAGILQGMKDLGGGGLTCGLSEMASKAGTGMEIDLDQVKTREPDMAPEELLISESQERMALIVKGRDEEKLRAILDKWEVSYAKIGRVTPDGILIIRKAGEIVAKAPAKFVAEAPLEPHAYTKPSYLDELARLPDPPEPRDLKETLVELLSDPNIASKEWIYRQYDHEVGLRTIVRPGDADAAVLRLPNGRTLSATSDGNSKECYLDPYWGTVGVLSEACSNLIATAAEPVAVVDHLQFGNPNTPEVYWTFRETIRAVVEYLKATKLPCVGGKVSFYNQDETTGKAIKPTPVIAAIGLRERKTPWISGGLQRNGDDLIIVGNTLPELGGSEYYEHVHGHTGGRVPRVNLKTERLSHRILLSTLRTGMITAAHDISKGGLAVALTEMAVKGERGFAVDTEMVPRKTSRADHLFFSENPGRFIFEVKPRSTPRILAKFKRSKIPAAKIGRVESSEIEFRNEKEKLISLPLAEARDAWSNAIPRIMEGAA
jgi:phosphoribosylformylglycinamidine synthase subunit PurL